MKTNFVLLQSHGYLINYGLKYCIREENFRTTLSGNTLRLLIKLVKWKKSRLKSAVHGSGVKHILPRSCPPKRFRYEKQSHSSVCFVYYQSKCFRKAWAGVSLLWVHKGFDQRQFPRLAHWNAKDLLFFVRSILVEEDGDLGDAPQSRGWSEPAAHFVRFLASGFFIIYERQSPVSVQNRNRSTQQPSNRISAHRNLLASRLDDLRIDEDVIQPSIDYRTGQKNDTLCYWSENSFEPITTRKQPECDRDSQP